MKRPNIMSMVMVSVSLLVVSLAMAAAQDRFTLKTPNGIGFSEFKGYEAWRMVASSQADAGSGCGTSPDPGCIKSILGNPVMITAYGDGIPGNAKPVPDGAAMAKIEWAKARKENPYGVTVPGKLAEVSFMMKDSKRFPQTDGWGYATFKYDAASDTWKAFGDGPEFAKTCHACHTAVKARNFVFTDYPKR